MKPIPHLGVTFLEVRVFFIHLKIEFGGGDRKSALYYNRGGHKLSWCAQANRTCQKEKTSQTSWNDIFQKIKWIQAEISFNFKFSPLAPNCLLTPFTLTNSVHPKSPSENAKLGFSY